MKTSYFVVAAALICAMISGVAAMDTEDALPLYLAVVADSGEAKLEVFNFISQSFSALIAEFPEDKELLAAEYARLQNPSDIEEPWKFPDSWHTTVLYLGGNQAQTETPQYQEFQPGKVIDLVSYTFVYVPGKIICAPVFPKGVNIANACPHMTLMMAEWGAVASNFVLEALFTNNGPLQEEYQNGFFAANPGTLIKKFTNVSVSGEPELVDVYLIKVSSEDHIDLEGVETKVYNLVQHASQ